MPNENFAAFVKRYTVRKLLAAMRDAGRPVTSAAVYHWCSGRRLPRPEYGLAIEEISRGEITIRDIYPQIPDANQRQRRQ